MKRAVTYARVSGDDRGKDGRNLAGQLEMGREYCDQRGYKIVAELAEDDRGASGASFELEQLKRMGEMAQAGEFDVLVVRELDRLSRNLAKQLIVEEELKRAGVSIEYVLGEYPNTPEGGMLKQIRGAIAEYERLKIAERITRGKQLKIRAGSVMLGCAPYGYDRIKDGNRWALEIYEPEAEIVRLIYSLYVTGDGNGEPLTMRAIARKLTGLGIPTRKDTGRQASGFKKRASCVWKDGTVGRILTNEAYRGVWWWNRRRDDDSRISVSVPAIVDDEAWYAARARTEHNRQEARRNRKYEYLLAGHARCGLCGSSIHGHCVNLKGKKYFYYICIGTRKGVIANVDCSLPAFRVDQYDPLVWGWVAGLLSDPAALQEGLDAYQIEQALQIGPIRDHLASIDRLLQEKRARSAKLLDLYLSGEYDKEILLDHKQRLDDELRSLETEHARLTASLEAQTLTPARIRSIHEFAHKVMGGLKEIGKDFDIQRKMLELLEVEATFTVENGQKAAYAQCVLGENILAPINGPS